MSVALPAPVQGHTGASNGFDGDALSGWVADDFLGNDNRGDFWEEKVTRSWLHLKINATRWRRVPISPPGTTAA